MGHLAKQLLFSGHQCPTDLHGGGGHVTSLILFSVNKTGVVFKVQNKTSKRAKMSIIPTRDWVLQKFCSCIRICRGREASLSDMWKTRHLKNPHGPKMHDPVSCSPLREECKSLLRQMRGIQGHVSIQHVTISMQSTGNPTQYSVITQVEKECGKE